MSERLPSASAETPLKRKGSRMLERIALMAGLALAPKATASEQIPRPDTTHTAPSSADQMRIAALQRQIAHTSPRPALETPAVQTETTPISPAQVGREGVSALLSDGDLQSFLASPGDVADFSAQALDDILQYRDTHLERLPTLEERRASRRQANEAIAQEVQRRIDDVLSGTHGGTVQQRQELVVGLSTTFSMMFDDGHRVLHTYSLDNGVFVDLEPTQVTIAPSVDTEAPDAEPGDDDTSSSAETPRMDPATDDPEDYSEDS